MRFPEPLLGGRLIRRYKRFLADVRLDDGAVVTAHCPNSGRMTACVGEDWPVRLSHSDNPRRKLPYTLEMVHNGQCWIGVHTGRANAVVREAIEAGSVPELSGYPTIRPEVKYGTGSRIDLLLASEAGQCFVEVKSTTLVDGRGAFLFPDAVTDRGRRHLHELRERAAAGDRAVVFFLVQRSDGDFFRPAAEVDAAFDRALREAVAGGVEALAYRAEVSPAGISVCEPVPVRL